MQLQACAAECKEHGLEQIASTDTVLLERFTGMQEKLKQGEEERLKEPKDVTEFEAWKKPVMESIGRLTACVKDINKSIQASVIAVLQKAAAELKPIAGGKEGQSWKAKLKTDATLHEVLTCAEPVLRGPMAARIAKGFKAVKQAQLMRCQNSWSPTSFVKVSMLFPLNVLGSKSSSSTAIGKCELWGRHVDGTGLIMTLMGHKINAESHTDLAISLVQDTLHRFGIEAKQGNKEVAKAYMVAIDAAVTSTEALILSIYSDTNMDDEKKRNRMNDAIKSVEKYGQQYGENLVDRLHPTIRATATSTLLQRGSWACFAKINKLLLHSYSKGFPQEIRRVLAATVGGHM
eukprot:1257580-Amphidinium_carterae.1